MKRLCTIFMLMLTLFLCGCNSKIYRWNFKKSFSEVHEISIININDFETLYEVVNAPTIKIIANSQYEAFYTEIQNLEMKKNLE